MISKESLEAYIEGRFGGARLIGLERLGAGVHGSGFSLTVETSEGRKEFVIKEISPEGLGHEYPPDRAAVFLLAFDSYNSLPGHVRAVDVLSLKDDGSIRSISGGMEYYLLMERAEGRDYFHDLREMKDKDALNEGERKKILAVVEYLREIHSVKKDDRILYLRKIRDIVGHGECLMGVFDSYPEGVISYEEMAEIERLCVDWRARLKPLYRRLCQIHGDFHPGNILFREVNNNKSGENSSKVVNSKSPNSELRTKIDFTLLDRSRGPWGDAADDVTALTINYIFFSIRYHGDVRGAYLEALRLFFDEYIKLSGDKELLSILAPFYAFRGVVVANPRFYPELSVEGRKRLFIFVRNLLLSDRFEPERVNEHIT